MSWLLSFVVASSVAHGSATPSDNAPLPASPAIVKSAEDLLASSARRIRSSDARIARLMAEGVRRSKTFAGLVSRLHDSDLIVYVESTSHLGSDTVGRILLQGVAGGQRYLRVQVRSLLPGDHIIAILGHELHHALEVAEDRTVIDEASLKHLYQRIGHTSQGTSSFDTHGARITGIRVRDELIG